MRSVSERLAPCAGVVACWLCATTARADGIVEPSYGRVEGDVTLAAGVGAVVAPSGPRLDGELRARYLETAGVFATYEDGAIGGSSADPRRVVTGGFELRPFFLYRWLRGLESRRARWDLTIDSIGLELGLTWPQAHDGPFATHPGFEAGLGVEVPLMLDATGLWLAFHGGLRWSDETLGTGVVEVAAEREAYLAITVAWHQLVMTHIVDVGDRAPR
jgi:hypothetical protein